MLTKTATYQWSTSFLILPCPLCTGTNFEFYPRNPQSFEPIHLPDMPSSCSSQDLCYSPAWLFFPFSHHSSFISGVPSSERPLTILSSSALSFSCLQSSYQYLILFNLFTFLPPVHYLWHSVPEGQRLGFIRGCPEQCLAQNRCSVSIYWLSDITPRPRNWKCSFSKGSISGFQQRALWQGECGVSWLCMEETSNIHQRTSSQASDAVGAEGQSLTSRRNIWLWLHQPQLLSGSLGVLAQHATHPLSPNPIHHRTKGKVSK